MITVPDMIGTLGVALILLCYYWLQIRKLRIEGALYSWLNLAGSLLILYSLFHHWNTPSVIIEIAWIAISVLGLIRVYRKYYV